MTPILWDLKFIQSEVPSRKSRSQKLINDDAELTYIYSFFAYSRKYACAFKYIIRAELYSDCFAMKYYCTRCKHSDHKYSRVLDLFSASETKRIMETCAAIIPRILKKHPTASFAFMGSRTRDKNNYIESPDKTQRYRIYCELTRRLFGEEVFYISMFDGISGCIFVNRSANPDILAGKDRIFRMFSTLFRLIED